MMDQVNDLALVRLFHDRFVESTRFANIVQSRKSRPKVVSVD
jgi:hypothetical protein